VDLVLAMAELAIFGGRSLLREPQLMKWGFEQVFF
jgi:hypothetical protein